MAEALYKEVRFVKDSPGGLFREGDLGYVRVSNIAMFQTPGKCLVQGLSLGFTVAMPIGNGIEYTGREFLESDLWKARPALKLWEIMEHGKHGDCFRLTNGVFKGAVVQVVIFSESKSVCLVVRPDAANPQFLHRFPLASPIHLIGAYVSVQYAFVGTYPMHNDKVNPLVLKETSEGTV